jgi:hypothetical protein
MEQGRKRGGNLAVVSVRVLTCLWRVGWEKPRPSPVGVFTRLALDACLESDLGG